MNEYRDGRRRRKVGGRRCFEEGAHQLRTAHGAVQAGVELALRRDEQPRANGNLRRANGAVRQAAKIVQQLLSRSRLD